MRCNSIAVLMESLHMRTIRDFILICSLILPVAAFAQSLSDVQAMSKEDRRSYIEAMSDDERTAMRDKWRAEFEQLPEEQKATILEQRRAKGGGGNRDRDAMRQRWESMSEEDRATAREKFRANGDRRRGNRQSMSEEERAAMREKRGEHKGQRQGGSHKGNAGAGRVESGGDAENQNN
jgi:hypothetical protein